MKILRIMKLTAFIILIACLHVHARGFGQTMTFSGKNVSLPVIFKAIEQQTGYTVSWFPEVLDKAKGVTIAAKNLPLTQFLDKCMDGQPLIYSITGQSIFIKPKPVTPATPRPTQISAANPMVTVQGHVFNEKHEPLEGASVSVRNRNKGTLTDSKGQFTLSGVEEGMVLVISYTGYQQKTAAIKENGYMDFELSPANSILDETKVIAYGTTTQRFSTGNVATVTSKDLEDQPVSNPLAAIEGRVPGVFITQQTGTPGGGFTVQIRGQNSIAAGNDPLYIVDGVPYPSVLNANTGQTIIAFGNPLNYLNLNDIERIDVLKDAEATAIYGSRGANGVILITTKSGKSGPAKFSLNAYSGWGGIDHKVKLMYHAEYLTMRREAFVNDGTAPSATDYDINGTWDTTRSTDWQKDLIGHTVHYQDYQGTVSGGSELVKYLFGGEYHRETTVYPLSNSDQKASVHFSINSNSANGRINTSISGSYVVASSNLPGLDPTPYAYSIAPDAPPVYAPDGSFNWQQGTWYNPVAGMQSRYLPQNHNLLGSAIIGYTVLKGLDAKVSFGYTNMEMDEITTYPTTMFNPAYNVINGSSNFGTKKISGSIIEPQLSYDNITGKGKLNVLLGSTIQENRNTNEVLAASGYTNDALLENISGAATLTRSFSSDFDYRYNALFGRVSYNWDRKYLLNFTGRRDGSSRFGPGKQFGNFFAGGLGWIFSEEDFAKKTLPWLSYGKLRASYGTSGNDQIPDYQYLALYNFTYNLPYQGATGLYPNNLANPDYAWEVNKKLEGGLETGFLHDRILFNISYYVNRSSNQLIGYFLPDITGFQFVTANLPATVQNKGLELVLNTVNIRNKNFTWKTTINLTVSRNKLLSFPGLAQSVYSDIDVVGKPLNIEKLFPMIGVNDTTGLYQYRDYKGNPTYSPNYATDRTAIVDPSNRYYGGIINSLQYKAFSLEMLIQFVKQKGPNTLFSSFVPPGFYNNNKPEQFTHRWQKPGDHAPFEKYTASYGDAFNAYSLLNQSDAIVTDASYIRLKNLSLSYQLPATLLNRLKVPSAKVYLQAQNLLTITHYPGADPENQTINSIPILRVVTTGIQVNF